MGDIGTVQARYEVLGETQPFERVEEPAEHPHDHDTRSETPPDRAASEVES